MRIKESDIVQAKAYMLSRTKTLDFTNKISINIVTRYFDLNNKDKYSDINTIAMRYNKTPQQVRDTVNKFFNFIKDDLLEHLKIKIDTVPDKKMNNYNMGLSIGAYVFLNNILLWRNDILALKKTIKDFLSKNRVDSFEDLIKFHKYPNITIQVATEIDNWYKS
jgi:hypothetical protein